MYLCCSLALIALIATAAAVTVRPSSVDTPSFLFLSTDASGANTGFCVTTSNECFFEDLVSQTPALIGCDGATNFLNYGIQNFSVVSPELKVLPSFPGFLQSASVTCNVLTASPATAFSFSFDLAPGSPGWSETVYVMQSGPIQNLCLGDIAGGQLQCCLGSPNQSSSCTVRLADCSTRQISYDISTQQVSVRSASSFAKAPLTTINSTHSWASWYVTPFNATTPINQTVAIELTAVPPEKNVYTFTAYDQSGQPYDCQTAPEITQQNHCFQKDSTKSVVLIGAIGTDLGLVYGDHFSTWATPSFPALLTSSSVDWSKNPSNGFSITLSGPLALSSGQAYVIQSGPFVQLCVADVNSTLACCLSANCNARLADGSICVLRYDAQQNSLTISNAGNSVTAPLAALNASYSWVTWDIQPAGLAPPRLVQNVTVIRQLVNGPRRTA